MSTIIRDAPFGQLVRYLSGNRLFQYPEERPDFILPKAYVDNAVRQKYLPGQGTEEKEPEKNVADLDNAESDSSSSSDSEIERVKSAASQIQRSHSYPGSPDQIQADIELALHKTVSKPIRPARTEDGTLVVDWYATDDPENPQNWSWKKKAWTAFVIDLYTFVVYSSSSIYVSSQMLIEERFGVGHFKGSLGLALYVLGYGIGPLIFSPLSEVPTFGRNIPYITTFFLFTVLALPLSLVDNLGGLLVLRFLLGFFGSPCLASGGASMGDIYSFLYLPYAVAVWVVAAFGGPAIGPLLSGFAVYAKNWRWSQWEILWMAAPVFLLFFFSVPETQPTTILLHRAQRLRKATGNEQIRSQTEVDTNGTKFAAAIWEAIIKPIEITVKDPAIMFVNLYTALTYGIYYSFFEVFPLVYPVMYSFNVGQTALVFLCIIVAGALGMAAYFSYLHFYLIPDILKNGLRAQEHRLVPALFTCFGPTIGLFLFGWTANANIHWFPSVLGIALYAGTVFIVMQCIFVYVPMSYPRYAASLFAGNDFFRSAFAFGAVLFGRPMFLHLGVGKGTSLLGGLSVMGIVGMFVLYFCGARLRSRSKFAVSG